MRRKSERNATKKVKSSPEKKVEKVKRTRTRRRKQSTSSENESADETSPVKELETSVDVEKKPAETPVTEDSPEETQDQVWHVKAAKDTGDSGEIQKLKICLTRPPSTPERGDKSPRSKRKHSRATSSSDTPSVEGVDDRKKSKHRSKRTTRESKDDTEKSHDSQGDEQETEAEVEAEVQQFQEKSNDVVTHSSEIQESVAIETPMSTTNEESISDNIKPDESTANESVTQKEESNTETEIQGKSSDADTTVASPKAEIRDNELEMDISSEREDMENKDSSCIEESTVDEKHSKDDACESLDKIEKDETEEKPINSLQGQGDVASGKQVSITEDENNVSMEAESFQNEAKVSNENDVVESSENMEKEKLKTVSMDCAKDQEAQENQYRSKDMKRSDSTQSAQEETVHNGQAAPIVISRKRRWGSRPSKINSQKSITISTDVLKDIIPDVKPAEFNEVIEDKKHHKRIEVTEKVERPVLPKIVIDNTEHIEHKNNDHKEKENMKVREAHLSNNRKISIIKENDNIMVRPPSPPRHKQSPILFITNLVRPFTLPQLKNLLQRTGRIVEDGFWIDKIKSKCFVKYETEDQAVETRHALHGVTWPVSNPKTLQVDFSTQEAFDKAKTSEETDNAPTSTIPGTVEDWLREQDLKRERGELEKPWERKASVREWDMGKGDKEKERDKLRRDERPLDKRRHRSIERSPEPARKFKKKEEEAPAKLLDDLFRKTKTTPCIYWLPLSAETIAIKEEQRRQHMAEHERRLQELRRSHRRH